MYPPSHLHQQASELIQIYLAVGSLLVLRRRDVGQFEGMIGPQGGGPILLLLISLFTPIPDQSAARIEYEWWLTGWGYVFLCVQYAAIADNKFAIKLLKEQCLVFLSSITYFSCYNANFLQKSSAIQSISVNLYKEYSYLKLNELEELPCFGVTIWQPSQLLWSALYYFSSNSFPFANLEKNRDMRNLF